MKISRRTFVKTIASLGLATAGTAGYTRYLEPEWFDITEKKLAVPNLSKPLRILHLSDFHFSDCVPLSLIERAVDLSLRQKADLAFLTGDFITSHLSEEEEYGRILKKLSAAMPCFACAGNHDGGRWAARTYGYPTFSKIKTLLESSGIRFLFNEEQEVNANGQTMSIIGLGDWWSRDLKPELVLSEKRKKEQPLLVLSHNPDSKEVLKDYDWDVVFCGHTHGGQLVVPLLGLRPFLPVKDTSFPEGVLTWGNRHIHITRGVGNVHGVRFNCRPEISFLTLASSF